MVLPKQKVVSRSVESEYKSTSNVTTKIIWLQSLLFKIGNISSSIPLLLCDNISATHLATNMVFHNRSKHIEIDRYFIRECVALRRFLVCFVTSKDQLVDIMTKPLASTHFCCLRNKLSIQHRPVSLVGDGQLYLWLFFLLAYGLLFGFGYIFSASFCATHGLYFPYLILDLWSSLLNEKYETYSKNWKTFMVY